MQIFDIDTGKQYHVLFMIITLFFIVSSVFIASVSFLRFVCSYLWAPSTKHWFKLVLFQKERRGEGGGDGKCAEHY